jgi:hypothetical protein
MHMPHAGLIVDCALWSAWLVQLRMHPRAAVCEWVWMVGKDIAGGKRGQIQVGGMLLAALALHMTYLVC